MLTEAGMTFAKSAVTRAGDEKLSRERLSPKDRKWRRNERARLLTEDAWIKYLETGATAVSRREAEAFFRLDDYVTGEARERKILRVVNAFGDDPELGKAVAELAELVRRTS